MQVVHIWNDSLGDQTEYSNTLDVPRIYGEVVQILRRETAVFSLFGEKRDHLTYRDELVAYFLKVEDYEEALDVVDLSFRALDTIVRTEHYWNRRPGSVVADEAISELNSRFLDHGIGYQFTDGQLIRIDSQLLHHEVVKPALVLLSRPGFAGAQEEFLKAHEYYRQGETKASLNECLKAMESTLKVICKKRNWHHDRGATCKTLLDICLKQGLIPSFWEHSLTGLKNMLEGSVPPARNKTSSHGQGEDIVTVPPHINAYVLHMAAACIVFLVEAEDKLGQA